MTADRILLTGATGFVGGATLRALLSARAPHVAVRLLTRRPIGPPAARVEIAPGDLTGPATLVPACGQVDTVVHLAAQIGGRPELCAAVNDEGTAALVATAERTGVRRIIALSTTAVYRDGSHRGAAEQDLPTGPASATSATRLAAEGHVLRFGGTVLRPHLVYGAGDRWVIPTLVDIMRRVHVDPESIEAKLSMVCVEDLARAIAALALGTEPSPGQRIYHANHPEPVEARELVRTVERELGGIAAAGADGDRPDLARRRGQLTTDHYYASERLWRDTGVDPGPGFAERFARHAAWYRESLTAAARH